METKVVKCTCHHEQQDEIYGKGMRLANPTAKGQHRCTVCLTLHGSQGAIVGKKK